MSYFKHAVKFGLTCAVFASLASAAYAIPPATVYVRCSKKTPLYPTISAGVAAATSPGTTVIVCQGNYSDNVTVTTSNLTIRADGRVKLTPGSPGAGFNLAASYVTIDGFEITGFTDPIPSGIPASGIYVGPGFGYALIKNNQIHGNGTGIEITHSIGYNWVTANAVYQNTADGIFDYATLGFDYFVANFVYQNGGAKDDAPPVPGQNNGIEISTTSITTCTDNAPCTAYLIGNIVQYNTADGVYLNNASNVSVTNNLMLFNGTDGLGLGYSSSNTISGNEANDNTNDGIEVDSNSTGSLIEYNRMFGNTNFDAQDESGPGGTGPGGVYNTWTKDYCKKDSPTGLCIIAP